VAVAVDRQDFGEKVGWVDEARKEAKTEKFLINPLLDPVKTHVDRLGLLRSNRGSRKTDRAFVVDEWERGDC
jgi:hypothetical protein